jgi:uncharacterized protein (TIGR03083 family)
VPGPGDPVDLASIYRGSRLRLTEVIGTLDDPKVLPVPCCPGWSVHDVLSHLVAVADDVLSGSLSGPPTDEQTAEQVARRADKPTTAVLDEWVAVGPSIDDLLTRTAVWPLAIDALTHEHDVRGSIGDRGARDDHAVRVSAAQLLGRLSSPVALAIECDGARISVGPEAERPELELSTDPFEAFRFRLGRRSRRQLAAMRWSSDPGAVLDHLTIFGPSLLDIVE